MLGRQTSWELGNRSYIRQKVIALYEQIFAQPAAHGASTFPPESVWRELFLLNVNAAWLRERVDAMSEGEIMGPRKPLFRELFSRCIAQLASEELGRHALETLGVLLSALGCKSFSDPSSDTLELFCGIQQVEAVMAELLGGLRKMLGGQNADLVHAAVSGALCVCCLTSNVDQSILIEFLSGEGLAQDVHGLLHGARPKVDSPALREQVRLDAPSALALFSTAPAQRPSGGSILTTALLARARAGAQADGDPELLPQVRGEQPKQAQAAGGPHRGRGLAQARAVRRAALRSKHWTRRAGARRADDRARVGRGHGRGHALLGLPAEPRGAHPRRLGPGRLGERLDGCGY